MKIDFLNYYPNKTKDKTFKAINILALLALVFYMTSFQTLLTILPVQAAPAKGKPVKVNTSLPKDDLKDSKGRSGGEPHEGGLVTTLEEENECSDLTGLGIVASGVGLFENESEGDITLDIPGEIVYAELYWNGRADSAPGDNTVTFDGTPVIGTLTYEQGSSGFADIGYRANVSNLVFSDNNTYHLADVNFGERNNGAGLLAVYRASGAEPSIAEIQAGLDFAHWNGAPPMGPNTKVYAFEFDSAPFDRTANLTFIVGGSDSEAPNRPDALWYEPGTGSVPTNLIGSGTQIAYNFLIDNNGAEWDTYVTTVTVPANDTFAAFQMESVHRQPGDQGESLSWIAQSLVMDKVCTVITLDKVDAEDPVQAGENITYTISGSVAGNATAHNVVLTDPIPEHTTYVSHTGPGNYLPGPNAVVWDFGDVNPGSWGAVQLVVQTESPIPGGMTVHNTAAIDSAETDPVQATEDTEVIGQPILTLDKWDQEDPVMAGTNITYTISGTVEGNATAHDATLVDPIPDGTQYVSHTGPGTYYPGLNKVVWEFGDVNPGAWGQVQLVVQTDPSLEHNTVIKNKAALGSDEVGPVIAKEQTTVLSTGDLTIIKFDQAQNPQSGVEFTINGTAFVTNEQGMIQLTDTPTGEYTVEETGAPEGYSFLYVFGENCTNSNPSQATVNLDETTTCTFTNNRDTGTIIVHKDVLGPDGVTNITDNHSFTVQLDGANNENINEATEAVYEDVPTSNHTISELAEPNYTLVSITNNGNITVSKDETTHVYVVNQQNPVPSVTLTKTITSSNLVTGGSINYQIAYQNTGNITLTNVQIVDDYPEQYLTVTNTGGATNNGSTLTWSIGNLAVGASSTVSYVASINSNTPTETDIRNVATIYSDQTQPVSDDAVTRIPAPVSPVLSIDKSVSAATVLAGDNLTYTITWALANATAHNVTITDVVPTNTTFVSADSSGLYNSTTNTVTWTLGTKAAGDSGTVTMTVKTNDALVDGTVITNTAVIDSDETSPVSDTVTSSIVSPNAPILQITKEVDKDFANPGDLATYTVVVTNFGSETAINLVLTDVLPAGLTYEDGGGTTKSFTLGDLAIGNSVTQTYDVVVDDSTAAGFYRNTATAQADNHDPVSDDALLEVRIPAVLGEETTELTIDKTVSAAVANPGDSVVYTVVISNIGDAVAENVVLSDQLPSGLTFLNTQDVMKVWELGNLEAEQTMTITYSATIDPLTPAGNYVNLAIVSADNAEEKQDQASLEVRLPKVLGALEETGTSPLDYLYYLIGFNLMIFGLWFYFSQKKEQSNTQIKLPQNLIRNS